MYFEQFYLGCLSHASYMIASGGIAAVVDPQRDIGIYVDEAAKHGFSIEHVIETHLHADFISGHRELAAATGAQIRIGHRAGAMFRTCLCMTGTRFYSEIAGSSSWRRPATRSRASPCLLPIWSDRPSRSPS